MTTVDGLLPDDPTAEHPLNYADCAYRDFHAGNLTRTAAILIVMSALRVTEVDAADLLDADESPRSRIAAAVKGKGDD